MTTNRIVIDIQEDRKADQRPGMGAAVDPNVASRAAYMSGMAGLGNTITKIASVVALYKTMQASFRLLTERQKKIDEERLSVLHEEYARLKSRQAVLQSSPTAAQTPADKMKMLGRPQSEIDLAGKVKTAAELGRNQQEQRDVSGAIAEVRGSQGATGKTEALGGALTKVAVAGVAAAAVLATLVVSAKALYARFDALGERFKNINSDVAGAKARQEVATTRGEIERGKFLGKDTGKFVDLQTKLQETVRTGQAALDKILITMFMPIMETINKTLISMLAFTAAQEQKADFTVELLRSLKIIGDKNAEATHEAIRQAANHIKAAIEKDKNKDKPIDNLDVFLKQEFADEGQALQGGNFAGEILNL